MKKVLSVILAVTMLCSTFAGLRLSAGAAGKKASALAQGETFYMGRWPQSLVTYSSLLSSLNALSVKLWSYEYKCSANSDTDYQIVDMSFGDIAYGGEVYRKVVLNQSRPRWTYNPSSSGNSEQDENGYTTGNTYWFRWDPIKWRTLKAEGDGTYVMSDLLLDSQPYNDIKEDITWAESTLRAWLSENFYQSAFSAGEKGKIVNYYHENENSPWDSSVSGGAATTDKVWLLSYSDAVNSAYGFSSDKYEDDTARRAQGSDYAKSQGLWVSTSSSCYGNSYWVLRSPGIYPPRNAASFDYAGSLNSVGVKNTCGGVRPAFKINPASFISGSADPAETDRIFPGSASDGGDGDNVKYTIGPFIGTFTTVLLYKDGEFVCRLESDDGSFPLNDVERGTYTVYVTCVFGLLTKIKEELTVDGTEPEPVEDVYIPIGDVNGDGLIDVADLSLILLDGIYATANENYDIDGSGSVDINDVSTVLLATNYGAAAAVVG